MDGLPTVAPNLRYANSEPSRPTRYSTSSENSDDNRSESRLSHFSNGGSGGGPSGPNNTGSASSTGGTGGDAGSGTVHFTLVNLEEHFIIILYLLGFASIPIVINPEISMYIRLLITVIRHPAFKLYLYFKYVNFLCLLNRIKCILFLFTYNICYPCPDININSFSFLECVEYDSYIIPESDLTKGNLRMLEANKLVYTILIYLLTLLPSFYLEVYKLVHLPLSL